VNYGTLTGYGNDQGLRAARPDELRLSLLAALNETSRVFIWGSDEDVVYVTGESVEARAEVLALTLDDVATWPPASPEHRARVLEMLRSR